MSGATAIGVFDSGVGGLSVLREIVRQLPRQDVLYFADTAHVPYGDRPIAEIRTFAQAIVAFLVEQGAGVIVVACNTASAAALRHLRRRFAQPIVGMEPAVKPAATLSRNGRVGVIATRATFQGALFASLVERFAQGTAIHTRACPGLVELVEGGRLGGAEAEAQVRNCLAPLLAAGIDSLVLGCTHYPFLRPVIERVVGPDVVILDPAPAVARQTGRVLARQGGLRSEGQGQVTYFTSGDAADLAAQVRRLVAIPGPVRAARWEDKAGLLRLRPVAVEHSPRAKPR